jgi:hypothetical protein
MGGCYHSFCAAQQGFFVKIADKFRFATLQFSIAESALSLHI